jgi:hypothetical protein
VAPIFWSIFARLEDVRESVQIDVGRTNYFLHVIKHVAARLWFSDFL